MPILSLVIPCYNEAGGLAPLIDRCAECFGGGDDIEVVFVDNGSSDDTPKVFDELLPCHAFAKAVRVQTNQGYGHGIIEGLRAATGDYLGWTHADMQTDPGDVKRALPLLPARGGGTPVFVKGRRYGRPVSDRVFTAGMGVFETVLLRRPLWDINAQPTLFPRDFFESWDGPPTDFSLDLYAYYKAQHAGLRIERLPVHFGERAHGISRWNVDWTSKWKFIKRTVDFSLTLRGKLDQ